MVFFNNLYDFIVRYRLFSHNALFGTLLLSFISPIKHFLPHMGRLFRLFLGALV